MKNCVLTVGKFEGIHGGHRALLGEVARRARAKNLAAVAAVFSPHPQKFLRDESYKPLFSPHERDEMILAQGIDSILALEFNAELASMPAKIFCEKIFGEFGAREIVVGENFRFGRGREGTIKILREAANSHGAEVCVVKKISSSTDWKIQSVDISTSKIRALLAACEFEKARALLGFPFFIRGEVTKGRQLGRVLGFPTLNLYPPADKFLPQNGVYETRTIFPDGVQMRGLTNIGVRPTVSDEAKISVETHIPKLATELYGTQIKVEFLRFIRAERRFESESDLRNQIKTDIAVLQSAKELKK